MMLINSFLFELGHVSAHIFIDSFSRRANGAVANSPLWRQDLPGIKNRKENKRFPVIDRWMYRNLTPPPAATGYWGSAGTSGGRVAEKHNPRLVQISEDVDVHVRCYLHP